MMKLTEKLIVMLIWLRDALSLLLIRIPLAFPLILYVFVRNGLLALFCCVLGDREDARYFMNGTSKMFKTMWESIKLEFSSKKILNDYYEVDRYLNEEEP